MENVEKDAIDCSRDENSEIRENIELLYGIKVTTRIFYV